jgi:hypothetical protein
MTQELWAHAWEADGSRPPAKRPRGVPGAIKKATRDLVKIYGDVNDVDSMTALYRKARDVGFESKDRPGAAGAYSFGRWLVDVAVGKSVTWMSIPPMPSIKTPQFKIAFDGETISWDGDSEPALARSNPHESKTLAETREILAGRTEKCYPTCQGWEVFETDTERGDEIQVCDECMSYLPKAQRLSDDDVAQLPEAQLALAKHGEAMDEAEREEVEGQVRVIAGDEVVPRGNPCCNPRWAASSVQSLLFDTDAYSPSQAKAWAEKHGFHYGKVHTTEGYHHLRQFEPTGKPCRTVPFGHAGVKAVVCAVSNHPDIEEDLGINGGRRRSRR